MKLGQVIICSNLVLSSLILGPKIPCLSIFSLPYLHLPLVTYIWPTVALITLILSSFPLIALIRPYVPYSPHIYILLLRLHPCANLRAIGQVFMDILHFKELGDT